jgi:hypothetical protein
MSLYRESSSSENCLLLPHTNFYNLNLNHGPPDGCSSKPRIAQDILPFRRGSRFDRDAIDEVEKASEKNEPELLIDRNNIPEAIITETEEATKNPGSAASGSITCSFWPGRFLMKSLSIAHRNRRYTQQHFCSLFGRNRNHQSTVLPDTLVNQRPTLW